MPENYTGIVEYPESKVYYLNGEIHREDGPAIIFSNFRLDYYLNGKLHRTDGPAIIFSYGRLDYYLNGKLHREDGPAKIYSDGTLEYYLNGKYIKKEVNDWIIENNIPDYKLWTKNYKLLFKLTFG